MSTTVLPLLPEGLIAETADALRHFYDFSYLGRHPILQSLCELVSDDPAIAVQKLRALLLDTIEELRPPANVPTSSPAWRPYHILYNRYVLGKELAELEDELGLGDRQVQREQQRGFAELAGMLWAKKQATIGPVVTPTGDTLTQEIARAARGQQAFDVREQLQRALAPVGVLAEHHGVELRLASTVAPLRVLGDPALVRQLLVSALSLLVRSAPSVVHISLKRYGARAVCSLAAQAGEGEPPHELPEALQVLAEANGAEISLRPEAAGCTIRIGLPAMDGQWTLVVVEDNRELTQLYSRYLSRRGYRVIVVNEPERALARIAAVTPDAVVLDVMMGGVDGWEILGRLRADPDLRDIPVAVCSVLDEAELATSLGADAYLRKPVMPAQLQECVAGLLGRPRSAAASLSSATRPDASIPRR